MELLAFKIKLFLLKQDDGANPNSYYDFSNYVQVGAGQTINLDDTIDTMSITLIGLPFRKEFQPTSLFRVVLSQPFREDNHISYYERTFDYALQQDDVEQPNMSEEYFTHNLSLANPAILAQQRTVDNIAVTYKLQDVALEDATIGQLDFENYGIPSIQIANYNPSWYPIKNRKFGQVSVDWQTTYTSFAYRYKFGYPTITYPYGILAETHRATEVMDYDLTFFKQIPKNFLYGLDGGQVTIDGVTYDTTDHFTFNAPLIRVERGKAGTRDYELLGYLPVDIEIIDTNITTGVTAPPTKYTAYPSKYMTVDGEKEISLWNGDTLGGSYEDRDYYRPIMNVGFGYDGASPSGVIVAQKQYSGDTTYWNIYTNQYEITNRSIRIPFTQNEAHRIEVRIKRHPMPQIDNFYNQDGEYQTYASKTSNPYVLAQRTTVGFTTQQKTITRLEQDIPLEINFTFNYWSSDYTIELFKQARQIDAYYLFNKAQLCVTPIKKESGVPYYESDLPFILNEADKTLLQRTLLNESDFLGKNLWEVFSEIGKYIHAKPRISIETDDDDNMTGRFYVNFLYYGRPEMSLIESTTDSIFNSRFAQEYIAELDSYVENYFNLGSYITEHLHATSDSDDDLIYNDVVKLITRYPILEVLKLQVANSSGVTHDITKYIFEYNVYKTLEYDVNKTPSKHRAIYYHLGTNIIEGMQFVTPEPTGVENAYSIKNIIGDVFGVTADDVNVNDYIFRLDYRIKDNVRVSITRPDLRKYLLNSKYDSYPIHAQFNQQQDKLVSSDNFGLNAYGKLIRTGNSTYNYYNWTSDINNLMQEGQLYETEDGLYYVSKINRIIYAEHIEENVELTKDFNRLAQIIGIPSQPRFYEISERNIVNRDVKFNEYIQVSATKSSDYIMDGKLSLTSASVVNAIISGKTYIPDGVISVFKGDANKDYDTLSNDMVYQVYTPLVSYSSKNTLTLEWDMEDNFSAGDKSEETNNTLKWGLNLYSMINYITQGNNTQAQAYRSKMPVRYVDQYGRADLFDYVFTKGYQLTFNEVRDLPNTTLVGKSSQGSSFIGSSNDDACWKLRQSGTFNSGVSEILSNDSGYIIAKDNRERMSFNYNAQLLLDSDRIILGNKLWIRDLANTNTKIVLLNTELNKFDSDLINCEHVIAESSDITFANLVKYAPNPYDSSLGYLYYYFDVENNISSFT